MTQVIDFEKIKVSNHAIERYVERIENYVENSSRKQRINQDRDQIEERLKKLLTYSEHIYTGQCGGDMTTKHYFAKDNIGLVVSTDNIIVTVYNFDFGLSEKANDFVIKDIKEKIFDLKEKIKAIQEESSKITIKLNTDNEILNSRIKSLEEEKCSLLAQIKSNQDIASIERGKTKKLNSELSTQVLMLFKKKF